MLDNICDRAQTETTHVSPSRPSFVSRDQRVTGISE